MDLTSNLGLQKPDGSDTFDIETFNTNMDIIDLIWQRIYPIGAIYMSASNINPEELFGGTWVEWGSGRVPVGVNTGDNNFNTVEKTGGASTHTLTIAQIPAHSHNMNARLASGTATGWHVDIQNTAAQIISTASAGGGQAHNNLQPYITCYMWKRTA